MRFKQAHDLLRFVIESRLMLAKLYRISINKVDNPRSQLLLAFLAGREKEQSRALSEYVEMAPHAALDTWFSHVAETDLIERLQKYEFPASIDEHELLTVALQFDNELMALLSQQVPNATSVETQELLLNLLAHEQDRQRRMVHGVARMDDM